MYVETFSLEWVSIVVEADEVDSFDRVLTLLPVLRNWLTCRGIIWWIHFMLVFGLDCC